MLSLVPIPRLELQLGVVQERPLIMKTYCSPLRPKYSRMPFQIIKPSAKIDRFVQRMIQQFFASQIDESHIRRFMSLDNELSIDLPASTCNGMISHCPICRRKIFHSSTDSRGPKRSDSCLS